MPVEVTGLRELRRDFRRVEDPESLTELRVGLKAAAEIVAAEARSRVPSKSGRARASVRATSGGNSVFVKGGKASVPYYGWLDFGSRTPKRGNPRSVGPWSGSGVAAGKGRFIYPAIDAKQVQVAQAVETAMDRALHRRGL